MEIADLNMSINIDYTRVTTICLLDRVRIGLQTKIINWAIAKFKNKDENVLKFYNKLNKKDMKNSLKKNKILKNEPDSDKSIKS